MMLCVLYKWKISNTFDDGREVSSNCRRHLMQCGRCRSFFTSSLALGERLSLEAAMAQPAVPARLGDRVATMIGHGTGAGGFRRSIRRPGLAAACAAIILAPLIFVAIAYFSTGRAPAAEDPATTVFASMLTVDVVPVGELTGSVGRLLEQPLTAEIEVLQRQARSAVEFLISCSGADLTIRREM